MHVLDEIGRGLELTGNERELLERYCEEREERVSRLIGDAAGYRGPPEVGDPDSYGFTLKVRAVAQALDHGDWDNRLALCDWWQATHVGDDLVAAIVDRARVDHDTIAIERPALQYAVGSVLRGPHDAQRRRRRTVAYGGATVHPWLPELVETITSNDVARDVWRLIPGFSNVALLLYRYLANEGAAAGLAELIRRQCQRFADQRYDYERKLWQLGEPEVEDVRRWVAVQRDVEHKRLAEAQAATRAEQERAASLAADNAAAAERLQTLEETIDATAHRQSAEVRRRVNLIGRQAVTVARAARDRLRTERDTLRAECDRLRTERDTLRGDLEADATIARAARIMRTDGATVVEIAVATGAPVTRVVALLGELGEAPAGNGNGSAPPAAAPDPAPAPDPEPPAAGAFAPRGETW